MHLQGGVARFLQLGWMALSNPLMAFLVGSCIKLYLVFGTQQQVYISEPVHGSVYTEDGSAGLSR